jgi:hypothetical protein
MFITEVARKYRFYLHFIHEKRKMKFVPFSWKAREIVLRNITIINEFLSHFNHLNLKYAEKIKGFEPSHIFVNHMQSIGFSNTFTQTIIFGGEEGNNKDTQMQPVDNIETIISTSYQHKRKGKGPNEKGVQSPIVS